MTIDNATQIERVIGITITPGHRPTEQELYDLAISFRANFPVTDAEFEGLLRRLHARFAITMDEGASLIEDNHTPWFNNRKASIDPIFWDRFRILLGRNDRPPLVINSLDRVTDEILDLAGDPERVGTWKRRGLVVGDVQSGKTETYTSLCCKAADVGYKLVILLTGTLENLRQQTQERLDEGFVGLDSSEMLQRAPLSTRRLFGVGEIDRRRLAGVFTSRSRDFNRQLVTQLGFSLSSFQDPVLVVLKKNRRILENFENWIRSFNAGPDDKIDAPVLLIDDEADSASINTNILTDSPTAINQRIRHLLAVFKRSSYVGFTATPFANVFIDPDSDDEMLGDDLFPRDFIYSLDAPSNYVGPSAVFGDAILGTFLQSIEDAEAIFPGWHRSDYRVTGLPESLREALECFLLATTIRDIQGEGPTHRSMLVNVSRFTAVQNQVADLLDAELREFQRDARLFGRMSPEEAIASSTYIERLHATWQRQFSNAEFSWDLIHDALNGAIQPIVVKPVNQTAGARSLDYRAHAETGLRVIAVGGNSLSRGLTLYGLSTSYFYRNSQMYDTLLQMGRWFGYRDGYLELCRLWITDEAALWYRHITEATEELRLEFRRMHDANLTPRVFGLKVRADPNSLIITARNKMRTARTVERSISLSRMGPETVSLRAREAVLEANYQTATRFIENVLTLPSARTVESPRGSHLWTGVPKAAIAAFLAEFQTHPLNFDFQTDVISRFLADVDEPKLETWDVAIPNGSRSPVTFAGLEIRPVRRFLIAQRDSDALLISGSKARVGSGGAEQEGLLESQIVALKAKYHPKSVPDKEYRQVRERPLLLLYLIRGFTRSQNEETDYLPNARPLVAFGLSFPAFDDSQIARKVVYSVNVVEWQTLFESEIDDDVPIDDDDAD